MKTYDSGYQNKKKRISKKGEGGVDFIRRMVSSMSNEKIQRTLDNNSASVGKVKDPTGRALFEKLKPYLVTGNIGGETNKQVEKNKTKEKDTKFPEKFEMKLAIYFYQTKSVDDDKAFMEYVNYATENI